MKKSLNRIMAMALASALMVSGTNFIYAPLFEATAVKATPAYLTINCTRTPQKKEEGSQGLYIKDLQQKIPIYSIVQENGWSSNYVKLRDIAYFIDFDVQWSADEPNVMRIYTNRHYLEPLESTGPATETKNATVSTMEMYVDDVKVDAQAYMIENNNYFKIRDIAKFANFACRFSSEYDSIGINGAYPYKAGDPLFGDEYYPERRNIEYESPAWYDSSSGTLFDAPIVQKASQPWARMNYYEKYASPKHKEENNDWKYISRFNAAVQALIDQETILSNTDGALGVRDYFVQHPEENLGNPYYQYPIAYSCFTFTTTITSIGLFGYGINCNNDIYTMVQPRSPADTPDEDIQRTKQAAKGIIAEAEAFNTDREALIYLGEEVCKRITYSGYNGSSDLPHAYTGLNDGSFWADNAHFHGLCTAYSEAFEQICAAAGYVYVRVAGGGHQWDEVFIPDEGKWVIMDCTYADGYDMYNTPESMYEKYLCCDIADYDEQYELLGAGLLVKDLMTAAYKARLAGE